MPIFRHIRTGGIYRLLCSARATDLVKKIVYVQMFPSRVRETGEFLAPGTVWVRDAKDFANKFEFVGYVKKNHA